MLKEQTRNERNVINFERKQILYLNFRIKKQPIEFGYQRLFQKAGRNEKD